MWISVPKLLCIFGVFVVWALIKKNDAVEINDISYNSVLFV